MTVGKRWQPRKRKFGNIPTEIGGLRFDSKGEGEYWQVLKLRERAGEITDLKRQVAYRLDVNGFHICRIILDYTWVEDGHLVAADYKGVLTPECAIKLKLLKAVHGLDVRLVRKK